jgi:predicted ATPase/DNA-binding SARP family transcriptional activator
MQIAMLGPLEVRLDAGQARAISGPRLARLLIVLALNPGQVVTTGSVVDAVWADDAPDEPGNAIQALVSRLRRAAPGIEVVSRAQGYVLDVAPDAVDVRDFERLVGEARRLSRTDPASAAATLRQALDLWRGPALVDAGDAEFARAARVRLDEMRLDALQERIDADLRTGHAPELIAELEGLVAAYPFRESFVKLLMRALHAAGDRGRALGVFESARARLADELGVAPSADLAAEHLRILRADEEEAADPDRRGGDRGKAGAAAGNGSEPPSANLAPPVANAAPPRLTNLRAEISSFVGRERDIAALDRLADDHRLVTLTGPGGAGKTRLAAHAARRRVDDVPGGVWLVELAPVTDPADLAQTVLGVLGIRDRALVRASGAAALDSLVDPVARLLAALADKSALLVLDNCEHLIAGVADLAATILGACPDVRIIATSREPLGVTGEALWPVEPLALPPDDPAPPADGLLDYASVRLLVQRAASVRPGFTVTAENAGVIARICRALDGMPLAIELAAARLRSMTPTQLADRLDDRFALLTAGSRTALPRHQTLRAVVDWSWDLLSDADRAMWRRLSVFTGGATLAAAEAVRDGGDAPGSSTLDVLTSLVDKSLLAVRDDAPEPRYMMLETIRAYGQLRLDEAGEREIARTAHAAYFERLANDASDKLLGSEQLPWLAKLTADHDNLYTAVRYATAAGDAGRATRLVGSLGWYWWLRGHRSEGVELVKAALALDYDEAGLSEPELEDRAIAYTIGALLTVDGTKEMSLALEWFDAGTEIVERIGWPSTPLLRLVVPLRRGVFETYQLGVPPADDDVGMPIDDPVPWIGATARIMRAHVLLNFGRAVERADDDFRAALAVYRQLGERWGTAFSLVSLGGLAAWRGDFRTAIENLDEALCCVTEMGAWEDRVAFQVFLARLLWADGDRDRAYASLAAAERDAQRLGVPEAQANVSVAASDLARLDGDLFVAADHLRRAEHFAAHDTVASQLRAIVASSRGYLEAARGDVDEARRWHRTAVDYSISPVDAPVIAQVLVGLAEISLLEGKPGFAATILGASAAVRGREDLSLMDGRRVTSAARAALGDEHFDAAYQRGLTTTTKQIGALVGIDLPELTATPGSS